MTELPKFGKILIATPLFTALSISACLSRSMVVLSQEIDLELPTPPEQQRIENEASCAAIPQNVHLPILLVSHNSTNLIDE